MPADTSRAVTAPDARQRRRNHITTRTHAHLLATSMQSQPHHETPPPPPHKHTRGHPASRTPSTPLPCGHETRRPRVRPHTRPSPSGAWAVVCCETGCRHPPRHTRVPAANPPNAKNTRKNEHDGGRAFSLALPHSCRRRAATPPPSTAQTSRRRRRRRPPVPYSCARGGGGNCGGNWASASEGLSSLERQALSRRWCRCRSRGR